MGERMTENWINREGIKSIKSIRLRYVLADVERHTHTHTHTHTHNRLYSHTQTHTNKHTRILKHTEIRRKPHTHTPDRDHSTLLSRHNIWNAIRYLDMASAWTTAFNGTSTWIAAVDEIMGLFVEMSDDYTEGLNG